MENRYSRIASILLSCCLLPHSLHAASNTGRNILDMSLEQLQNVVITDTKVAQSQDTVTQRIEVVDAAEIGRHTTLNRNISELLMYRSGLFYQPPLP